jgi:hypothetical protein
MPPRCLFPGIYGRQSVVKSRASIMSKSVQQGPALSRAHVMIRGLIFGIVRIVSYRSIGFVSANVSTEGPVTYTPNAYVRP